MEVGGGVKTQELAHEGKVAHAPVEKNVPWSHLAVRGSPSNDPGMSASADNLGAVDQCTLRAAS